MPRYVAFLRGINLGSTNKVSMPRLRELAEGLGYTDVVTYINSGNLVLTATDPAATIEQRLHAGHRRRARPEGGRRGAYAGPAGHDRGREPLPGRRPQLRHGGLPDQGRCPRRPSAEWPRWRPTRSRTSSPARRCTCTTPQGQGRSKLAAKFSDVIGVSATVRNLRTVTKVLELAVDDEASGSPRVTTGVGCQVAGETIVIGAGAGRAGRRGGAEPA